MRRIAVDASTRPGNPGPTEYRGVDLSTGEVVFSEHIGVATNNIGEFLAIADAATLGDVEIYSDSKTAIAWIKKGKCNTNFFKDYGQMSGVKPTLSSLISDVNTFVSKRDINVFFWDNKKRGEIPADYGRKRQKAAL